jgi:hypothetical protein
MTRLGFGLLPFQGFPVCGAISVYHAKPCRLPPLQTGRAGFPHPAFPEFFAGGMHDSRRLASQRNGHLGEPRGLWPVLWEQGSMLCSFPRTTMQLRQGSFARPALPGVLTTMSPSDSPRSQVTVIYSRQLLADRHAFSVHPRRGVSQVPRWICRCPPSSITPEGPAAACARYFAADCRLHLSWRDGHPQSFNEAESGSRFRITADTIASHGFGRRVTPAAARSATWRTSNYHG